MKVFARLLAALLFLLSLSACDVSSNPPAAPATTAPNITSTQPPTAYPPPGGATAYPAP